jgi:hypothetical protein
MAPHSGVNVVEVLDEVTVLTVEVVVTVDVLVTVVLSATQLGNSPWKGFGPGTTLQRSPTGQLPTSE